jgi:nitrate reductase NapE component
MAAESSLAAAADAPAEATAALHSAAVADQKSRSRGKRKPSRPREAQAERPSLDIAGIDPLAAVPTPVERAAFLGMLLRFVSCGILALISGLIWRLTLAPARVGIGTSLLGILFLLLGFIIGGILWYVRDVRARARDPERVSDERLVFSFIVFVVMPFAVGVVVGIVWLVALIIGTS